MLTQRENSCRREGEVAEETRLVAEVVLVSLNLAQSRDPFYVVLVYKIWRAVSASKHNLLPCNIADVSIALCHNQRASIAALGRRGA